MAEKSKSIRAVSPQVSRLIVRLWKDGEISLFEYQELNKLLTNAIQTGEPAELRDRIEWRMAFLPSAYRFKEILNLL